MVAILHPSDLQKARGTLHQLTTEILEFEYFSTTKTSILLIRIQKGIRHQIRVHLAALGYPLCGDKLYSKAKHKDYNTLQLFSVGLEII
ncbi:MAG: hypothetical protein LBD75_05335 [Candidatus Peribacteria bacterium]|jgi:23S rRNA pseudouridine1911/1915/1917 synthase|nr:hypothetical protein [Candidatus Peribacteria bacterium]